MPILVPSELPNPRYGCRSDGEPPSDEPGRVDRRGRAKPIAKCLEQAADNGCTRRDALREPKSAIDACAWQLPAYGDVREIAYNKKGRT